MNVDKREGRPRIAASYYLNSAPLVWSFLHGSMRKQVQLLSDAAPARCADMLARGQADAALVPVIEYQRLPEVAIVPGVCVGAASEVRSVVLVTRGGSLEDVESIALDTSSRTSAALVEIIFREFLGKEPKVRPTVPDLREMLKENDAALMIGDPAMTFVREGLRVYDMAALWREHTGLGFVFAMWMTRGGDAGVAGAIDFAAARDEGLAGLDEIVDAYEDELGLPRADMVSYLRDNIRFHLDADMLSGLELFFHLAYKHGLTPGVRPLKAAQTES
jgi:chorismate dehydratase